MPGVITTLSNNAIRVLLKRNFKGATSSQCSIRIKYRLRRRRTRCNNTKHIRKSLPGPTRVSSRPAKSIRIFSIEVASKSTLERKLYLSNLLLHHNSFQNILMFQKSPLIYIASGNKISQFSQCTS